MVSSGERRPDPRDREESGRAYAQPTLKLKFRVRLHMAHTKYHSGQSLVLAVLRLKLAVIIDNRVRAYRRH